MLTCPKHPRLVVDVGMQCERCGWDPVPYFGRRVARRMRQLIDQVGTAPAGWELEPAMAIDGFRLPGGLHGLIEAASGATEFDEAIWDEATWEEATMLSSPPIIDAAIYFYDKESARLRALGPYEREFGRLRGQLVERHDEPPTFRLAVRSKLVVTVAVAAGARRRASARRGTVGDGERGVGAPGALEAGRAPAHEVDPPRWRATTCCG